jgi:hypothetical protein
VLHNAQKQAVRDFLKVLQSNTFKKSLTAWLRLLMVEVTQTVKIFARFNKILYSFFTVLVRQRRQDRKT